MEGIFAKKRAILAKNRPAFGKTWAISAKIFRGPGS